MPTNHIEKRIESPEVDSFQGRHFGSGSCGRKWKWLFTACHTDVSFKLPPKISIKHVQVLKESINLN